MNILTKDKPFTVPEAAEITLRLLGLNNSYKGFHFLIYGIDAVLKEPTILTNVCKGLYIDIAFRFHTSVSCVERNIRTARENVFKNGNEELVSDIFDRVDNPDNAAFIDALAFYIRQNLISK